MAMLVEQQIIGIDVCKDCLDIYDGSEYQQIDNTVSAIQAYLGGLPGSVWIAMEPTNRYHLPMLEAAIARGHLVYLINPYRLYHYREGLGVRAKTDKIDSRVLRRYLAAEHKHLQPATLAPKAVRRIQQLLKARAKITRCKVVITQALAHVTDLGRTRQALINRLQQSLQVIDRQLLKHLSSAGYTPDYQRCLSIPGIGALNAAALVSLYRRGVFRNADAFISFMGMDVRVRESGRFRGKRKLTKRGNPEIRRLLFNAAKSGARTEHWRPYYLALRQRGLSATAAYVALARKIARLAFVLLNHQTTFQKSMA